MKERKIKKTKRRRVGIYICHCGRNIAGYVDIPRVMEAVKSAHDVVLVKDQKYMCSDQGQSMIEEDLERDLIDRVIVSSCSPTMHERTFRKCVSEIGFNPYQYQQIDIRENCSWVTKDIEEATTKASEIIKAGISRVKKLEPLWASEYPVTPRVMIIGAGIAGITAAVDVLEAGFGVVLVDIKDRIGGWTGSVSRGFSIKDSVKDFLNNKINILNSHAELKLYLSSTVANLEGFPGNFKAVIKQADGTETEEDIGSIIVASGFSPFDARKKPEFSYDKTRIITTVDMEEMLGNEIPDKFKDVKRIAFIQCVGSRDKALNKDYCSHACCMVVAKQGMLIKEMLPDARISVFYMDIRAFGKGYEELYEKAQRKGVLYIRGNPSELCRDGDEVIIHYEDTLLGRTQESRFDLVILAVGMEPSDGSVELSKTLRITRDKDGFFMEAHPKLGPLDTHSEGIYVAGCCQAPKDIPDTVAQAHGAAARATLSFHQGKVTKEPVIAVVDADVCSGCCLCEAVCSYNALEFDIKKRVMTIKDVVCRGCGACAALCPSGAMSLKHYRFNQMLSWVEGFLV
jgi:heterodisulfide reductase subunit A